MTWGHLRAWPCARRFAGYGKTVIDEKDDEVETREELREVEEALRDLREEDISPPGGAADPSDVASAITQRQEQAALIDALESRRARLRRRLGLEEE